MPTPDTTPYIRQSLIGVNDGIAELDNTGNVPLGELENAPVSHVGDILLQAQDTSATTAYTFSHTALTRLDGGSGNLQWSFTSPSTGWVRAQLSYTVWTANNSWFELYFGDVSGTNYQTQLTSGVVGGFYTSNPGGGLYYPGYVEALLGLTPSTSYTVILWGKSGSGSMSLSGPLNGNVSPVNATFYAAAANANLTPFQLS